MNLNVFVIYILLLTTGLVQTYSRLKDHFNDPSPLLHQISDLQENLEKERFRHLLTQHRLLDFRQEVATYIPEAVQRSGGGEAGYPVRALASTLSKQNSDRLKENTAESVFNRAKRAFSQKRYEDASHLFRQMIQNYSYSVNVAQAYFLLVESEFQLQHFDDVLQFTEKMVHQFPENELTGYALLRTGKIYEFRERPEDAGDIYRTVIRSFPMRDLASEAQAQLKEIEL